MEEEIGESVNDSSVEKKDHIALLKERFTKMNMYNVLKDLVDEKTEVDYTLQDIVELVKPQKGGSLMYPPKEIDGVTYYWCRFKQEYTEESKMDIFDGKCKGTSKLAREVAYRINKEVKELKAKALEYFTNGDLENGAKINAEADNLAKTIEDPATFTDEAMAVSRFHPDFGKKKKEVVEKDTGLLAPDEVPAADPII